MDITISGYSTALFSTWYFIEQWGLLFDAGDGLNAGLLQKSRKIKNAFISHADRDHVTGLLQFNQLNARSEGYPRIHYPRDSASFTKLEAFSKLFDPHVEYTQWIPITPEDTIQIKNDLFVRSFVNSHVQAPEGVIKSLSYQVIQTTHKLKKEFLHLGGEEIRQMGEKIGKENLTETHQSILLSYSGDTPVENGDKWNHSDILIHESTFIHPKDKTSHHSLLEEVIEMASSLDIKRLILGHFSSRYDPITIDAQILHLAEKYQMHIPIYRILPGQTQYHILDGIPIHMGH
jgi:ribonuclease Z